MAKPNNTLYPEVLSSLLNLGLTLRYQHWSTKSANDHLFYEEAYNLLDPEIDALVEINKSYGLRPLLPGNISGISFTGKEEIISIIENTRNIIKGYESDAQDVSAVRDNILAIISKLLYKLQNLS